MLRLEQQLSDEVTLDIIFLLPILGTFNKTPMDSTEGIEINGKIMRNIKYVGNPQILDNSNDDLQNLMSKINQTCK